jgi:hypothetical protein
LETIANKGLNTYAHFRAVDLQLRGIVSALFSTPYTFAQSAPLKGEDGAARKSRATIPTPRVYLGRTNSEPVHIREILPVVLSRIVEVSE